MIIYKITITSDNNLHCLQDEDGISAFQMFLQESEGEEEAVGFLKYVNFYRDCDEYKKSICRLESEAKRICEEYLEVHILVSYCLNDNFIL